MRSKEILNTMILIVALSNAAVCQCGWVVQRGQDAFGPVCITFADSLHGWAGKTPNAKDAMLRTTNGGRTWDDVNFAYNIGRIYSVSFVDSLRGWAIDGTRLHQSKDGGRTWVILTDFSAERIGFGRIGFVDSVNGFSVSADTVANLTRMRITTDGGITWSSQQIKNASVFNGMKFTDRLRGWIVGDYLMHTTDGGHTWEKQTYDSVTVNGLGDVCFVDSLNGWCAADHGWIIRTTDGGKTWNDQMKLNYPVYGPPTINAVSFASKEVGWAFGYVFFQGDAAAIIYNTVDSGNTWNQQSLGLSRYLGGGIAVDRCHAWAYSSGDGSILGLDQTTSAGLLIFSIPETISLSQNYPNPFNPTTTIFYELLNRDHVKIELYDEQGRKISLLEDKVQDKGAHTLRVNMQHYSTGAYFYTLTTSSNRITKKMLLIH